MTEIDIEDLFNQVDADRDDRISFGKIVSYDIVFFHFSFSPIDDFIV